MINERLIRVDSKTLGQIILDLIEEFEDKYNCKGLVQVQRIADQVLISVDYPGIQIAKPGEIGGFELTVDANGPSVKILPKNNREET